MTALDSFAFFNHLFFSVIFEKYSIPLFQECWLIFIDLLFIFILVEKFIRQHKDDSSFVDLEDDSIGSIGLHQTSLSYFKLEFSYFTATEDTQFEKGQFFMKPC